MESERRDRRHISAENMHVCNFSHMLAIVCLVIYIKGLITGYIYMEMSFKQQSNTFNALYKFAIKVIISCPCACTVPLRKVSGALMEVFT